MMTRKDREDLAKLCRMRAKLARTQVAAAAAQLRADFQKQLAATYPWDSDEVWKQVNLAADQAEAAANAVVAQRCKELGIPRAFAPSRQYYWNPRGENAIKERRAELTRVANTRIEQMTRNANLQIDHAATEIQTNLLADGLESSDAKAFLESMPTAAQLMPAFSIEQVQKQLPGASTEEDDDDGQLQSPSKK